MTGWTLYDCTMVALLLVCFVIGVAVLWALREIDKDLKRKSLGRWQDMPKKDEKIKKDWSYRWMVFTGKVEDFFLKLLRIKRP